MEQKNKGVPCKRYLKVLSYWNLNKRRINGRNCKNKLKVLSYWNLNFLLQALN